MMLALHLTNCNVSNVAFQGFVVFVLRMFACMFIYLCCFDLMWTPVRSSAKAVKAYRDLNKEITFVIIEFIHYV